MKRGYVDETGTCVRAYFFFFDCIKNTSHRNSSFRQLVLSNAPVQVPGVQTEVGQPTVGPSGDQPSSSTARRPTSVQSRFARVSSHVQLVSDHVFDCWCSQSPPADPTSPPETRRLRCPCRDEGFDGRSRPRPPLRDENIDSRVYLGRAGDSQSSYYPTTYLTLAVARLCDWVPHVRDATRRNTMMYPNRRY